MPTPQGDITSTETWSEVPTVEEEVEVIIKEENQEKPE